MRNPAPILHYILCFRIAKNDNIWYDIFEKKKREERQ